MKLRKIQNIFFYKIHVFVPVRTQHAIFFNVHKVWIYVSSSVQKMSSFVNKFCCGYSKTNYVKSSSFQDCLKTDYVTTPPPPCIQFGKGECTLEKQGILLTHCFNLLRYTSFLCLII